MSDRVVFPLPLVPFEEYMLIDDRPTHPMSFFFKLALSGPCDSAALDTALMAALQRHPLLTATVEEEKRSRFAWSHDRRKDVTIQWLADNGSFAATHIDLCTQPGLRVSAQQRDDETWLFAQFHHSCCDAIGALRFIEDLLVAYHIATAHGDAERISHRLIHEHRLRDRGQFGMTRWKLVRMARKQAVGLLGARQFLMRTPVPVQPIGAVSAGAALPGKYPTALTHEFSDSETVAIAHGAKWWDTTVNNLLIRDLFLALGRFRSNRQLGEGGEWLRLSIPINLRRDEDERLSAANVVSMVFLDRRPHDFHDAEALLDGIGREMRLIKANQLGLTFPLSLRFTRSLPGAIARMRRMSAKPICRGTAVLSNLVRPLLYTPLPRCAGKIVAGGMTLERIEFLPPIRPYTLAAFGVLTYADRLNVSLHFDPRGLSQQEASELLQNFVNCVGETTRPHN